MDISSFYEPCGTMRIFAKDEQATYLKLFPFLLIGKTKNWLRSQLHEYLKEAKQLYQ